MSSRVAVAVARRTKSRSFVASGDSPHYVAISLVGWRKCPPFM
jgi:hypothetical protein